MAQRRDVDYMYITFWDGRDGVKQIKRYETLFNRTILATSTTVRGIEIAMCLEDVGACLGVPSEGERISHGFTPDTEGWENFNNLRFYFSMSKISEHEFYARHARSNSTKLFLSSKNLSVNDRMLHYFLTYMFVPKAITKLLVSCGIELHRESSKNMGRTSMISSKTCLTNMGIFKDVDGLYKHTDVENAYAPPPAPGGGYTLELIYNKIHEMDILHSYELRAIRTLVA
ncbi:hypothetical protein KIW84_024329 [Lathyrus oleraceus]|uniref:Uncharacterized protein n=1 Tax=Pisum sativum TaxID=3888 RepID=A0A9D4YJ28_PEA|nr:hypothetical protein KIW84_024329 [Pisum sativum]